MIICRWIVSKSCLSSTIYIHGIDFNISIHGAIECNLAVCYRTCNIVNWSSSWRSSRIHSTALIVDGAVVSNGAGTVVVDCAAICKCRKVTDLKRTERSGSLTKNSLLYHGAGVSNG